MKKFLTLMIIAVLPLMAQAQRFTDRLDRGLVAQKTAKGVFLSWRIFGEEYYDVQYNVYRDGTKINEEPLNVSNFTDASGSTESTYSVAPVVRGTEQAKSKAVKPWKKSYMEITPRHDPSLTSVYVPNDACCCDVDGDGELEILMKYDNASEIGASYPRGGHNGEYTLLECLKMDGTVLWWVNCGPNMGDFQNNEINIIGYDWDMDGKAEVVFRAADGTTIHQADGAVYTVGNASLNYRGAYGGGTNWFMHAGREYLLYVNGETGKPYQCMDFPLARLEPSENPNGLLSGGEYDGLVEKAWGDGYGHRSSKYFFGAPYLDGKKPSIFLARGIYTQHKMKAFDVNPNTHQLELRWKWYSTGGGYWMWQGYHNYGIADVDMDGRDEICFGSMVIDDNGKGLSTTGFGHGDAQHCGDFNPYIHGQEIYACMEEQTGNNYRDATTSKVYHRFNSGNDDGRAMAGNFSNSYPGGQGCSAREGLISLVYNDAVPGLDAGGVNTNFRIYWDGDLLEETFNYLNGKNTEGCIAKYGSWSPIFTCEGSMTNNDTKGTPCYQGDLFGDWREEIMMRTADNKIRIFSTPTPTSYRNYTLWHDHQYRNAMVWQMCGYNQPPHASYFLGELEGITQAPPPLTMTDRTEVKNGGSITSSLNDKHVIVRETGNSNVSIADGASPYILTFNVPSWVQGNAYEGYTAKDCSITYDYFTCNVTGGAITGNARLVKQGDGILNLPKVNMTHSGETNIWEGKVNFDGSMPNSPVWMGRFTELNSDGGLFKSLRAQYGATIRPGGKDKVGNITVSEDLYLDYGSRIEIDINGSECDKIKAKSITAIRKLGDVWTKYGPEFVQPVIEIKSANLQAGDYVIAECETLNTSLTSFKVIGVNDLKVALKYEDGKVILSLGNTRGASMVYWSGAASTLWNYANDQNFYLEGDAEKTPEVFVHGDLVEFNDEAQRFLVNITEDLKVDTMRFVNTKDYTLNGNGAITSGALYKEGSGTLTINTKNSYNGGNFLKGGTVVVSSLANDVNPTGNLGGVINSATRFTMEGGATIQTSEAVTNGSYIKMVGSEGGVINNSGDFVQQKPFSGTILTKKGNGWLKTTTANSNLTRLVVAAGTLAASANAAKTVELRGSAALVDYTGTSNTIDVTGTKTSWTTSNDVTYTNKLTGSGKITAYCAARTGSGWVATRTPLALDLSRFGGTLVPAAVVASDGRFTLSTSLGSDSCTFEIASGVKVQNSARTLRIGAITGTGSLGGYASFANDGRTGTNTWDVGNEKDFTFGGIVTSGDKFNKLGTGTMTVNGAWDCTGGVTISEGAIRTSGAASLGTGALTIGENGKMMGTISSSASLKNSSVTVNGVLSPGTKDGATTGTFIFNKQDVTITERGTLRMGLYKVSTSATGLSGASLKNIGKLTINGTISIALGTTYTPQVGDQLRLWTGVDSFEGSPTVVCDNRAIHFSTSRLSEGILVVDNITLMGDVDGDGVVTMADANMVVNRYLGVPVEGMDMVAADMDGDGQITMADANAIVNLYLGM